MNYLLGIDLGTTNIKGIIISEEGSLISSASLPCKSYYPGPSMVEQNANEWWSNCASILRSLTSSAGVEIVNSIKCISISSQIVSLLPVDKNGAPLRNAIMYQDSRSSSELDEICSAIGLEKFMNIIGGQPSVAFLPNKILWFRKNEPELFAQTASFLQANGYLNFKLTGAMTLDADCASRTQCYNISDLSVSKEVSEAIGADLAALLPPAIACTDIIGTVTAEAAAETGLAEGTAVVAGCSDAMASMYATGLSALGEVGESSGTSSLVFVGSPVISKPDVPVVTRPCYIKGIPYIFDAPISSSGASLKWFINSIGQADAIEAEAKGIDIYSYLEEMAGRVPAGSDGLLFFPYMVGGERAPLWNAHARGMFIGMNINTTRDHMIRAILEGTAFALRHVISTVSESGGQASLLKVTGGGSHSHIWNQIKASILHMPVCTLEDNGMDVPLGDCLIAGTASGVIPDLTTSIQNIITVKEEIYPIPEWEEAYDKLYPYYIEMYSKLDDTLKNFKATVDTL